MRSASAARCASYRRRSCSTRCGPRSRRGAERSRDFVTLYLNDIGVIGPLGAGKAEVLARLLAGDGSGMEPYDGLLTGRTTLVGRVRADLPAPPVELAELDCRNNRLLAHALDQIAEPVARSARHVRRRSHRRRARHEHLGNRGRRGRAARLRARRPHAERVPLPAAGDRHGRGVRGALSRADRPALHDLDGVLVVGQGVCLRVAAARRRSLRCRDRRRCRQPLQADAERLRRARVAGAGSLQSVQRQSARHQHRRRRVRVRRVEAALRRSGSAASASRPTATISRRRTRRGRGAEAAIRAALAQAGAAPRDVGYVNLHGTATPKNDEMESEVMARVFGLDVPCSSTKSLIGHTLGAAGAQELGFCWLAALGDANVGAALAGPRLGRRRDPEAAADQSRRRRRGMGARPVRVELVRVRRQQRRDRRRPSLMDCSAIPIGELLPHGPEMTRDRSARRVQPAALRRRRWTIDARAARFSQAPECRRGSASNTWRRRSPRMRVTRRACAASRPRSVSCSARVPIAARSPSSRSAQR